jgi:ubiquinone/menaquinone biosynthesis C-methylase UbiE
MSTVTQEWHQRYVRQASWTRTLRQYLFQRANLTDAQRILEVGCGTGAVLSGIEAGSAVVHGLDISRDNLILCAKYAPQASLALGDALRLPYSSGSFDLIYTHFVLLWLPHPEDAIQEMKRVSRPGGFILSLAEPDYGGRIDYPEPLDQLGDWQSKALQRQGANPRVGRLLAEIYYQAGLDDIQTGVLGGEWQNPFSLEDFESEWATIERDLHETSQAGQLAYFRDLDRQAWLNGSRVLFVPTFFAWGKVRQ